MLTTIEWCYKHNAMASFYSNLNDTESHLTGYIGSYNEDEILIQHISAHGQYDGYILKRISDIFRIDHNGEYEKKIEQLYKIKAQHHPIIPIKSHDITQSFLRFAKNSNKIISVELQDSIISGTVEKYNDMYLELGIVNDYGVSCGRTMIDLEKITTFSLDTDDEQDLQLLVDHKIN